MALAFTFVNVERTIEGVDLVVYGQILPTGEYPTGGVPVTGSNIGMSRVKSVQWELGGNLLIAYTAFLNMTTRKVQLFDFAGDELADQTDLTGVIMGFRARGY